MVVAVVKVVRDDDAVISVALCNTVVGCRSLKLIMKHFLVLDTTAQAKAHMMETFG